MTDKVAKQQRDATKSRIRIKDQVRELEKRIVILELLVKTYVQI